MAALLAGLPVSVGGNTVNRLCASGLQAVMDASGFNPKGHNGKLLMQILEVYPRDDLFQIDTDELTRSKPFDPATLSSTTSPALLTT